VLKKLNAEAVVKLNTFRCLTSLNSIRHTATEAYGVADFLSTVCLIAQQICRQQILGSCSPDNISTTLEPPIRLFMMTVPGCPFVTSPITAASVPNG
jgi:hypothetical protein